MERRVEVIDLSHEWQSLTRRGRTFLGKTLSEITQQMHYTLVTERIQFAKISNISRHRLDLSSRRARQWLSKDPLLSSVSSQSATKLVSGESASRKRTTE